jgi:phosphopantothenoylcysteine synthetase/decarboxylase
MRILVTAGNTQVPIDQVRCITNIFTGRTGAAIALAAHQRGHAVTLLTSHPDVVAPLPGGGELDPARWTVTPYRTFADLQALMESSVRGGGFDALIHCAAVSDYLVGGVYAPASGTRFEPRDGRWRSNTGDPVLMDRFAGKVKSDEPELWLRLVRAPKLVDLVRGAWGYRGLLVKFKLEVGIGDQDLLEVAERSRRQSGADLMVANTLEGSAAWAYFGPVSGRYERIARDELPSRLLEAVERGRGGKGDG